MLAIANWCLAVVQGTIRSWVPLGFPSPAIRPVRNAGECPKFLHWGHAEALSEPRGFLTLGLEKGGTAPLLQHHAVVARWESCLKRSDGFVRRGCCCCGISPHCGRARGRCEVITRRTRRDSIRPGGFVCESIAVRFAVMCWAVYPLLWSYIPEVDLLPPMCAGAAASVAVCLDAIWATGLAFDCLVWAVLAEAEFLAALTVLGGAYPPQFPLILFSESGPSWLCGWPALGGGRSGFASRLVDSRFWDVCCLSQPAWRR